MKIISRGNKLEDSYEAQHTCSNCGSVFSFTRDEVELRVLIERGHVSPDAEGLLTNCICPVCSEVQPLGYFHKSGLPSHWYDYLKTKWDDEEKARFAVLKAFFKTGKDEERRACELHPAKESEYFKSGDWLKYYGPNGTSATRLANQ